MSGENPKYLSAYTGVQIDKAYRTVSNIQPSGNGKLVMINTNGELIASPFSSGDVASKPINWDTATLYNFIQYDGAGGTRVSEYNANSFMRSVIAATNNNIPSFYKQGNIIYLQDSGISTFSIQNAFSNIESLSNNEIVSGNVNLVAPESLILNKKGGGTINIDLTQLVNLVQRDITDVISQVQVDNPSKVPSSALMYSVNSRVVALETQLSEALQEIISLKQRVSAVEGNYVTAMTDEHTEVEVSGNTIKFISDVATSGNEISFTQSSTHLDGNDILL